MSANNPHRSELPTNTEYEPGQRIAEFEVINKLGQGAMGAVYKVQNVAQNRICALKLLPLALRERDPEAVKRFGREARALIEISHKNVMKAYQVGVIGGQFFLEIELVEGEDLESMVARSAYLNAATATNIVLQAAQGLAVAHEKNIIHRDIKPENILVAADGVVKVADFGLGKNIRADDGLTGDNQLVGTPYFMPPEQWSNREVDARSDLYALGATFYYVLTGEHPYVGRVAEIMYQHLESPVPDPRKVRPEVPEDISRIVVKLMAKRPEDRYPSAQDLIKDLRALRVQPSPIDKVDPLVGRRLGDYSIITYIGQGPSGKVFRTRNLRSDSIVALKVFHPQSLRFTPKEFIEKTRTLARLKHPNIVRVIQGAQIAEWFCLELDYINGMNLDNVIRKGRKLSVRQAAGTIRRIALALCEAHEQGIVHGNVKPTNVLFTRDGDAMLTDFAIGAGAGGNAEPYVSPECVDGSERGVCADLYALGATFFYALIGEDSPTPGSPREQFDPTRRRADVPNSVRDIVLKLLSAAPNDRYASARDVVRDLQSVREELMASRAAGRSMVGEGRLAAETETTYFLVCVEGPRQAQRYRIAERPVIIGRDYKSHIFILDQMLSRRHAQVVLGANQVEIRDLGSRNGTQVNGQPITHAVLHEGDKIQIGSSVFVLERG